MWMTLKEYNGRIERNLPMRTPDLSMFSESIQDIGCKIAFLEGFNAMRRELETDGMYTEANNKAMEWLKSKLKKLCPSPEKLGDFVKNWGAKIDKKVQNSKFEALKKGWNKLKELAAQMNDNSPVEDGAEEGGEEQEQNQETPDQEVGNEESQGSGDTQEGEGEGEGEQQQVNEGIWDNIKSGWNKLTGKQEQKPTKKKSVAKKATSKKAPAKKSPTKKPTAKGKGKGKSTGKKGKKQPQTKMQKALAFCKQHWKAITIILISLIAVALAAWGLSSYFGNSKTLENAVGQITNGDGAGSDPYADMDADDANDAREMDELEQAGKEQGIDVSDKAMSKELGDNDVVNSNPVALGVRNGKELKAAIARM